MDACLHRPLGQPLPIHPSISLRTPPHPPPLPYSGADRFKWEDVKEVGDYRDYYLGHSVAAPQGRWQKGKDLFWYNKAGKRATPEEAAEQRKLELAEIRRRDEDMINAALGLAPKQHAVVETKLEPNELKALLAKGVSERDGLDAERVEGLGAAPAPRHEHIPKGLSMVEREIERMKTAQAEGTVFQYDDDVVHLNQDHAEHDDHNQDSSDERKRKDKKKKHRKKEEKKRKKEEKRERKKEKARATDEAPSSRRRSRSDSPDDRKKRRRTGSASRSRSRDRGRDRDYSRERRR